MEDVKYSSTELHSNKEGVSILFYMQKIFPGRHIEVFLSISLSLSLSLWPFLKFWKCEMMLLVLDPFLFSLSIFYLLLSSDEWENFLERVGSENLDVPNDEVNEDDLRNWASFRGQTLSRTGNASFLFFSFRKNKFS